MISCREAPSSEEDYQSIKLLSSPIDANERIYGGVLFGESGIFSYLTRRGLYSLDCNGEETRDTLLAFGHEYFDPNGKTIPLKNQPGLIHASSGKVTLLNADTAITRLIPTEVNNKSVYQDYQFLYVESTGDVIFQLLGWEDLTFSRRYFHDYNFLIALNMWTGEIREIPIRHDRIYQTVGLGDPINYLYSLGDTIVVSEHLSMAVHFYNVVTDEHWTVRCEHDAPNFNEHPSWEDSTGFSQQVWEFQNNNAEQYANVFVDSKEGLIYRFYRPRMELFNKYGQKMTKKERSMVICTFDMTSGALIAQHLLPSGRYFMRDAWCLVSSETFLYWKDLNSAEGCNVIVDRIELL